MERNQRPWIEGPGPSRRTALLSRSCGTRAHPPYGFPAAAAAAPSLSLSLSLSLSRSLALGEARVTRARRGERAGVRRRRNGTPGPFQARASRAACRWEVKAGSAAPSGSRAAGVVRLEVANPRRSTSTRRVRGRPGEVPARARPANAPGHVWPREEPKPGAGHRRASPSPRAPSWPGCRGTFDSPPPIGPGSSGAGPPLPASA
jgi:hypothetical protein